jgi:hypothetical protein
VAIFDAEEPPYFGTSAMGSIRFYEDQLKPKGVHAALIMDLVGHDICIPGSTFGKIPSLSGKDISIPFLHNLLFITGAESNQGLVDVVSQHITPQGLKILPTLNEYVGDMSDHGIFRENGVPYLFLSCGRWEHYAQATDTPDRLNYKKMASITHYLCELLQELDLKEMERGTEEQFNETLELEIQQVKKILGPAYKIVLKKMGIRSIQTREDMTDFAEGLLETGL